MNNEEYNSDFLNYNGKINRKNYVINLSILVALYVLLSATDFTKFMVYTPKYLITSLFYILGFLKFVIIIAIISVIYRRIADFANFDNRMKTFFILFYFFPFLYLCFGHFLLDFAPGLIKIFDWLTLTIILPLSIIFSILFAFFKSQK